MGFLTPLGKCRDYLQSKTLGIYLKLCRGRESGQSREWETPAQAFTGLCKHWRRQKRARKSFGHRWHRCSSTSILEMYQSVTNPGSVELAETQTNRSCFVSSAGDARLIVRIDNVNLTSNIQTLSKRRWISTNPSVPILAIFSTKEKSFTTI